MQSDYMDDDMMIGGGGIIGLAEQNSSFIVMNKEEGQKF